MSGIPSRSRRHRPLLVVLAVATLSAAPASTPAVSQQGSPNRPQQQEVPRFEQTVEVVRIQAVVLDAEGAFVPGLGPADFRLMLGGEPRTIVDVMEMEGSRLVRRSGPVGEGPEPVESGDVPLPPGAHRQFLIYLDMTDPNPASFRNARSAARDFVDETVRPEDRLGLALYSNDVGMILMVPFTRDHVQVEQALDSLTGGRLTFGVDEMGEGIPLDDIRAVLGDDAGGFLEEMELTRYAMSAEAMTVALTDLANALGVLPGRKHVLFFSRGMSDRVFEEITFVEALEDATEALRVSDVVVHTLQPDLMRGISDHDPSNMQSTRNLANPISRSATLGDRSLLYNLAEETGGEAVWFRHRLRGGLEEIEERTRNYYVIAFQMRGGDPLESEIRLEVAGRTVDAPERLRLASALASMNPLERSLRLASALELGEERDDLALSIAGIPTTPDEEGERVMIALQIPGSELAALAGERGDGRVDIEMLGMAVASTGQIVDVFQGRAASADVQGVEGVAPLRYVNEIRVPRGNYRVKLLVRETGTDAMSVRSISIDNTGPRDAGVRVAGPLPVRPAAGAPYIWGGSTSVAPDAYPLRVAGAEVAPDLSNVVFAGETRDFFVRVDGLQSHPFNGNVEWSLRTEAIGIGNRVITLEDAEIVLFDDADVSALRMVVRVPFGTDLVVGPNELTIRVLDLLTGAVSEGRWDFTVLPR